jgi:GlpG protein
MRLICSISPKENGEDPYKFSHYLASQGIENECEEAELDGKKIYHIWIYDEDQIENAKKLYETYQSAPQAPVFYVKTQSLVDPDLAHQPENPTAPKGSLFSPAPHGKLSLLIIAVCLFLFIFAQFQQPEMTLPSIPGVLQGPILAPVEKALIFDYPEYFTLRDELLTLYPADAIEKGEVPSIEAQTLLKKLYKTPVWMGWYDRLVERFLKKNFPNPPQGTFAPDVLKGEVWRLFSPSLLHLDFLHIFFNLLWFVLLGNQVEFRIGFWRYLLLLVVTASLSNLGQYVVSGPFFMGLSGVVCALAAFIWARQQVAPWEGYLLQRFTLIFLTIFVLGMLGLQVFFFFLQVSGISDMSVGIANTAHIVGALSGYGLGRMKKLFAIKKISPS